jgi:exopolysaccharide biosynthesis polyprenyl glycosylphosphotransferase
VYTLLIWFSGSVFVMGGLSRIQGVAVLVLTTVAVALTRAVVRQLTAAAVPAERILVVGNKRDYARLNDRMVTTALPAQTVGRLDLADWGGAEGDTPSRDRDARLAALAHVVEDLHVDRAIIVSDDESPEVMLDLIRAVKGLGVRVSVLPRLLEVVGSAVAYDDLYGMTVMGVRRFGLTRSSAAIKRVFDLAAALTVSLVLAPLFALIAICIKLDSRGPILFRQQRIGRNGESFPMYKFRSMVDGADQLRDDLAGRNETDGLFKIVDDPRITRVGRILRHASLDELPQLLNVWRGQMSIVGPRPLVVDEDAKVLGLDRRRLTLTPGMTGPWQILGSAAGRIPLGEMVKIDYLYIANWSLWGDAKIVLRTIPYVMRRSGV